MPQATSVHIQRRGRLLPWPPPVFFFQAEDGIRDKLVTGVQTCALPISRILAGASQAVRAQQPVQEARLADVRPPHEGDLRPAVAGEVLRARGADVETAGGNFHVW